MVHPLTSSTPGNATLYARVGKRLFDCVAATLALVALSPVLLICGFSIALSSGRPILYRQKRIGRGARPFTLYKFRTMVPVDSTNRSHITSADDPHITPVGRIMRKWKLDELPQLLNVLRGDMSLVGPRPQVSEKIQILTEIERALLKLRPGLTGLSALCNRREEEALANVADKDGFYLNVLLPRKVKQELYYLNHVSFGLDLRLLFTTFLLLYCPGTAAHRGVSVFGQQFNPFSDAMKLSVDLAVYASAMLVSYWIRFEGRLDPIYQQQLSMFILTVPLLRVLVNHLFGIYKLVWRYHSLYDTFRVVAALVPVSALLLGLRFYLETDDPQRNPALFMMPLSIVSGEFLVSCFGSLGMRAARSFLYQTEVAFHGPAATMPRRLLLVGAGAEGAAAARRILVHSGFEPVGFVDDNPLKQYRRVGGVQVIGTLDDLTVVADHLRVKEVVVCADGEGELLQQVQELCRPLSLPVWDLASFYSSLESQDYTGEEAVPTRRDEINAR